MAPVGPHDDAKFILSAFSTIDGLKMNFSEVAPAVGMKQSGHASAKFQGIIKKYGFQYDRIAGTLSSLTLNAVPATPKKAPTKAGKESAKKTPAKKRKLDAEDEPEDEPEDKAKVE